MRKGDDIPCHKDPIPPEMKEMGYRSHHRLNIVLNKNFGGGSFIIDDRNHDCNKRIFRFRPDRQTHWVTPILFGTRYVLSIGWLSKHENKRISRR